MLLISLIQKLLLMLFQGEATYRQLFCLNTHLYLFTLLASLIMAVMMLLLGPSENPKIYPTSLAALVPAEGAVLRGVLNGIELFALWKLFLAAKGTVRHRPTVFGESLDDRPDPVCGGTFVCRAERLVLRVGGELPTSPGLMR